MANLYANFLEELPTHKLKNDQFIHLNGQEVPSTGKVMAKEKKFTTTSRSRQGILHIKRDLLGYNQSRDSEECGIVNYSLFLGGYM